MLNQTATVSVKLTLAKTDLLCQESTDCAAELRNERREALRRVNPGKWPSLPMLLLTDVASGQVTRHSTAPADTAPGGFYDVAAGATVPTNFPLSRLVRALDPGVYDVQALYDWGDGAGQAVSPPVRMNVRPANPGALCLAPTRGAWSALWHAAWINRCDPQKPDCELWLSSITTSGRPRVASCARLIELKRPIEPVLSIPANAPAGLQWVAWIEGDTLNYLAHCDGEVTEIEKLTLSNPYCRILPPLLLNPQRPNERLPGAIALIYEPTPDGAGGQILQVIMQLSAKGATQIQPLMPLPDLNVEWAGTAYPSNARRNTFLLTRDREGLSTLKLAAWTALRPPGAPVDLASWDFRPLVADLMLTRKDAVVGALIGEVNPNSGSGYVMVPWVMSGDAQFQTIDPIAIAWPAREPILRAVVRVNEFAASYALLQADDRDKTWYYCLPNGRVVESPVDLREPVSILFRYGDDPTILYTNLGRGFRFAKPVGG